MNTIIVLSIIAIILIAVSFSSSKGGGVKIPSDRKSLTRYLKNNFQKIKEAKKMTISGKPIPKETKRWLKAFAQKICQISVETKDLSVEEKFAAIFLVNYLFHNHYSSKAEQMKNYLFVTVVKYHQAQVNFKVKKGNVAEITYGIWCTHIPGSALKADRTGVFRKRLFS